MIKWFKKLIYRWAQEGSVYDEQIPCEPLPNKVVGSMGSVVRARTIDQHGLNFSVYSAQGGTIIELRSYDERTDQHSNKLYVVRDDQDLGTELDHIITLEALKR